MNLWSGLAVWRMLDRRRTLAVALLCFAVIAVLRVWDPPPVEVVRLRLFDSLQALSPREFKPAPIAIVDIDEASIAAYGQWPWPRSRIAALVGALRDAGVAAIGFDVIFAEADRLSPALIARDLDGLSAELRQAMAALPSNDSRFADNLRTVPTVLGMSAQKAEFDGAVDLPSLPFPPVRQIGGDPTSVLPQFARVVHSIPELLKVAAGHAVLTIVPEPDGVVRRVPLAVSIGGQIVPALSVEMARVGLGVRSYATIRDESGLRALRIGDAPLATQSDGRAWVHYTRHQPERYVSVVEVLEGRLASDRLAGHLVLVGTSAIGLGDFKATPTEANMPGVEIHAQILEMMFSGARLDRPRYATAIEVAMAFVAGAILAALVPMVAAGLSPVLFFVLSAILVAASYLAYLRFGLLVDPTYPVVSTAILLAALLALVRAATERARRALQEQLQHEREAAARIEGELSAARDIQMGILPRDFPAFPGHTEFDLHAMLEPAKAVGGDLYDFAMLDDTHLFFMVGDVSGKGVPASLFMAISKALYKSSALRHRVAIADVMNEANIEISRENPADMFVTLIAGVLDIQSGRLDLCNAGHEPPILLHAGAAPEAIEVDGGPPLCAWEDFEYPAESFTLQPGDALVVLTDGVTEAMTAANDAYGAERAKDMLGTLTHDAPSATLVDRLYTDVQTFIAGNEPSDDVTILAVRYLGPPA